jgi:hypothetical protein
MCFVEDFLHGHGVVHRLQQTRRHEHQHIPGGSPKPQATGSEVSHAGSGGGAGVAVRFPAGANVAQAFGHDAAGMGEISMPIIVPECSRGRRMLQLLCENDRQWLLTTD